MPGQTKTVDVIKARIRAGLQQIQALNDSELAERLGELQQQLEVQSAKSSPQKGLPVLLDESPEYQQGLCNALILAYNALLREAMANYSTQLTDLAEIDTYTLKSANTTTANETSEEEDDDSEMDDDSLTPDSRFRSNSDISSIDGNELTLDYVTHIGGSQPYSYTPIRVTTTSTSYRNSEPAVEVDPFEARARTILPLLLQQQNASVVMQSKLPSPELADPNTFYLTAEGVHQLNEDLSDFNLLIHAATLRDQGLLVDELDSFQPTVKSHLWVMRKLPAVTVGLTDQHHIVTPEGLHQYNTTSSDFEQVKTPAELQALDFTGQKLYAAASTESATQPGYYLTPNGLFQHTGNSIVNTTVSEGSNHPPSSSPLLTYAATMDAATLTDGRYYLTPQGVYLTSTVNDEIIHTCLLPFNKELGVELAAYCASSDTTTKNISSEASVPLRLALEQAIKLVEGRELPSLYAQYSDQRVSQYDEHSVVGLETLQAKKAREARLERAEKASDIILKSIHGIKQAQAEVSLVSPIERCLEAFLTGGESSETLVVMEGQGLPEIDRKRDRVTDPKEIDPAQPLLHPRFVMNTNGLFQLKADHTGYESVLITQKLTDLTIDAAAIWTACHTAHQEKIAEKEIVNEQNPDGKTPITVYPVTLAQLDTEKRRTLAAAIDAINKAEVETQGRGRGYIAANLLPVDTDALVLDPGLLGLAPVIESKTVAVDYRLFEALARCGATSLTLNDQRFTSHRIANARQTHPRTLSAAASSANRELAEALEAPKLIQALREQATQLHTHLGPIVKKLLAVSQAKERLEQLKSKGSATLSETEARRLQAETEVLNKLVQYETGLLGLKTPESGADFTAVNDYYQGLVALEAQLHAVVTGEMALLQESVERLQNVGSSSTAAVDGNTPLFPLEPQPATKRLDLAQLTEIERLASELNIRLATATEEQKAKLNQYLTKKIGRKERTYIEGVFNHQIWTESKIASSWFLVWQETFPHLQRNQVDLKAASASASATASTPNAVFVRILFDGAELHNGLPADHSTDSADAFYVTHDGLFKLNTSNDGYDCVATPTELVPWFNLSKTLAKEQVEALTVSSRLIDPVETNSPQWLMTPVGLYEKKTRPVVEKVVVVEEESADEGEETFSYDLKASNSPGLNLTNLFPTEVPDDSSDEHEELSTVVAPLKVLNLTALRAMTAAVDSSVRFTKDHTIAQQDLFLKVAPFLVPQGQSRFASRQHRLSQLARLVEEHIKQLTASSTTPTKESIDGEIQALQALRAISDACDKTIAGLKQADAGLARDTALEIDKLFAACKVSDAVTVPADFSDTCTAVITNAQKQLQAEQERQKDQCSLRLKGYTKLVVLAEDDQVPKLKVAEDAENVDASKLKVRVSGTLYLKKSLMSVNRRGPDGSVPEDITEKTYQSYAVYTSAKDKPDVLRESQSLAVAEALHEKSIDVTAIATHCGFGSLELVVEASNSQLLQAEFNRLQQNLTTLKPGAENFAQAYHQLQREIAFLDDVATLYQAAGYTPTDDFEGNQQGVLEKLLSNVNQGVDASSAVDTHFIFMQWQDAVNSGRKAAVDFLNSPLYRVLSIFDRTNLSSQQTEAAREALRDIIIKQMTKDIDTGALNLIADRFFDRNKVEFIALESFLSKDWQYLLQQHLLPEVGRCSNMGYGEPPRGLVTALTKGPITLPLIGKVNDYRQAVLAKQQADQLDLTDAQTRAMLQTRVDILDFLKSRGKGWDDNYRLLSSALTDGANAVVTQSDINRIDDEINNGIKYWYETAYAQLAEVARRTEVDSNTFNSWPKTLDVNADLEDKLALFEQLNYQLLSAKVQQLRQVFGRMNSLDENYTQVKEYLEYSNQWMVNTMDANHESSLPSLPLKVIPTVGDYLSHFNTYLVMASPATSRTSGGNAATVGDFASQFPRYVEQYHQLQAYGEKNPRVYQSRLDALAVALKGMQGAANEGEFQGFEKTFNKFKGEINSLISDDAQFVGCLLDAKSTDINTLNTNILAKLVELEIKDYSKEDVQKDISAALCLHVQGADAQKYVNMLDASNKMRKLMAGEPHGFYRLENPLMATQLTDQGFLVKDRTLTAEVTGTDTLTVTSTSEKTVKVASADKTVAMISDTTLNKTASITVSTTVPAKDLGLDLMQAAALAAHDAARNIYDSLRLTHQEMSEAQFRAFIGTQNFRVPAAEVEKLRLASAGADASELSKAKHHHALQLNQLLLTMGFGDPCPVPAIERAAVSVASVSVPVPVTTPVVYEPVHIDTYVAPTKKLVVIIGGMPPLSGMDSGLGHGNGNSITNTNSSDFLVDIGLDSRDVVKITKA